MLPSKDLDTQAESPSAVPFRWPRSPEMAASVRSILCGVLDPMGDALVVLDQHDAVVYANPTAQTRLGLSRLDGLDACPQASEALASRILRGEVGDGDVIFVSSANPNASQWWTISTWPLAPTTTLGRVILVRDITEAKRAAEAHAREKAETEGAGRAKSEFLRRISQEVRSHLNSILGFAQMLTVDTLAPHQHSHLQRILSGGYHVLELINQLVDLALLDAGPSGISPEPIRIREAVKGAAQAVQSLASERNLTLRMDIESCCDAHVRADRPRLRQALVNLLSSAMRCARSGGVVSLTCRETPGNRVRLEICEDSSLLGEDQLKRLFATSELSPVDLVTLGDGELGFTLTQKLVKTIGANIGLETTAEGRSRLFLEFSLLDDPLERLEGDAAAMMTLARSVPQAQRGVVLYFEDNPTNLTLMERILAFRPGITLLQAMDAKSGLALAEDQVPDWILLDLHLPDMPGEKVVQRLRENSRTCRIPISVLSGDAAPETVHLLLAAGVRDYLTKPLDMQKLLNLLDHTLRAQM